ncbi:outer membrane beta-barrel protein [Colwellia sp. MEBiC06753]
MRLFSNLVLSLTLLTVANSYATGYQRSDSNFNFPFVEGDQFIGNVKLNGLMIDNFLFSEDTQQSTTGYQVEPSLFIQSFSDHQLLQIYADANYKTYAKFSDDQHTDITALGKYFIKTIDQQRAFFSASFNKNYEFRGTGLSQGIANTLAKGDTRETALFNLGYQIGRPESVSRLNALIGAEQVSYSTRKLITSAYEYDRIFAAIDFNYLLSGKTYLATDFVYGQFNYKANEAFNRLHGHGLIGVKWQPSVLSELKLLLGYQAVSFDENNYRQSSFSWLGQYLWQPSELFTLSLKSARSTDDTSELNTAVKITDNYGVDIKYQLTDTVNLGLNASYRDSLVVLAEGESKDKRTIFNAKVNYKITDTVLINGEYLYTDKEANLTTLNYNRQIFSVGLELII